MVKSFLADIRTKYNILSPSQKEIADYVINNPDKVIFLSIGELAEVCGTSEPTIMRFLRKLGCRSYQHFKVSIAQEVSAGETNAIYEEIKNDDTIEQIKQKIISLTVTSIQDINKLVDEKTLQCVVNLITQAERIFFLGIGGSGIIAKDAFHKFLRLGLNVDYSCDSHIMSIYTSSSTSADLIMAFSHSGESSEVIDAVRIGKENKAKTVVFTGYHNSTLAKLADVILMSSTNETMYRSQSMVSRLIQLVVIDILYVALVLNKGEEAIENVNRSKLAVAQKKV